MSWNLLYENLLIHTIQKTGDHETINKNTMFCFICFFRGREGKLIHGVKHRVQKRLQTKLCHSIIVP